RVLDGSAGGGRKGPFTSFSAGLPRDRFGQKRRTPRARGSRMQASFAFGCGHFALEQQGDRRLICRAGKGIRGIMTQFKIAVASLAAMFLVVSQAPTARSEALFSTP